MTSSDAPYRPVLLLFALVFGAIFLFHYAGHAIIPPNWFAGGRYLSALPDCRSAQNIVYSDHCNVFISFVIVLLLQVLVSAFLIVLLLIFYLRCRISKRGRFASLSFRLFFNLIMVSVIFGAALAPGNVVVLWGSAGPSWGLLGVSQIFIGVELLTLVITVIDPEYFSFIYR